MTDARFPERWLNDRRIRRLSADGFRLFVLANAWSVSNRTDGRIEPPDLDDLGAPSVGVVEELVTAGLWQRRGGGWLIVDFDLVQTTRVQLEAAEQARLHERNKKRRQRAHQQGDHSLCSAATCGVSPGTSPGTTQDRPGQARTGALEDGDPQVWNGSDREHRVAADLAAGGWQPVMRAAASKGPADLLMAPPVYGAALVQVGSKTKTLGPADRERLLVAVELCSTLPLFAIVVPRQPIAYRVVDRGLPGCWELLETPSRTAAATRQGDRP